MVCGVIQLRHGHSFTADNLYDLGPLLSWQLLVGLTVAIQPTPTVEALVEHPAHSGYRHQLTLSALFLGHDWNQMPDTTLYDHVKDDEYAATMTFPG
jgi:hypothetical protein